MDRLIKDIYMFRLNLKKDLRTKQWRMDSHDGLKFVISGGELQAKYLEDLLKENKNGKFD